MTIDYDQLRQVLHKRAHGDTRAAFDADFWLYEHKVAIAEELLALRDGVDDLAHQFHCRMLKLAEDGNEAAAYAFNDAFFHLDDLLKGHDA